MMALRQLHRDVRYRGRIIDLIVDEVEYPDGSRGIREIAHHPGGAVAVPLLGDGRVILVRQLRYPIGGDVLELPAGKLSPGEDPAHCAARELEEETGWIAGRLTPLTSILTTPGFCDEVLHLFVAEDLRESPRGHQREPGEYSMTVEILPLADALGMVENGTISDAKTIVGLLLADRRRRGR
jgi:ADP-ribose pyrophosphatase